MIMIPSRTCCCGFTLRIGTLIIGVISLVCSAASFILIITCIPTIHQYRAHNVQEIGKHESTTGKFLNNSSESFTNKSSIDDQTEIAPDYNDFVPRNWSIEGDYIDGQIIFTRRHDMSIIIPYLVGDVISLVSSILLIIGALKRNKWLLIPWIAYTSLSVIVGIVASVYNQIRESYYVNGAKITVSVLCVLIGLGIYLYMLSVVLRHFEELRTAEKDRISNPGKIYAAPNPWVPPTVNELPYP